MALFCLFDLKLSFGLLWSKWFSSVCFLWWCVPFVLCFFYIWYLFCLSLLCTHSLECLLPSANGLIWSGGSKLTSWAGDKMMKLHSQNNQGGIFSLKRESWRRGHRIQHGNSDMVLRSLWLFGGILIIFLERGVDTVSWFIWGCFVNEANIIPFGIFSWHATSWITWGDIWDWPILYRLLSLSYNQRRALHIVPILVELPVSTSLFISAFVLFSCCFEVAILYLSWFKVSAGMK